MNIAKVAWSTGPIGKLLIHWYCPGAVEMQHSTINAFACNLTTSVLGSNRECVAVSISICP